MFFGSFWALIESQPTNAIVAHFKKDISKELKEKTSLSILVFLANTVTLILLFLVITMHCKLSKIAK